MQHLKLLVERRATQRYHPQQDGILQAWLGTLTARRLDSVQRRSRVGRVRPLSLLLGRIGRWSGKEIAHPALSLARSAQAERDNESCFFVRAADVHQFRQREGTFEGIPFSLQFSMSRLAPARFINNTTLPVWVAALPPAPGWLVERRPHAGVQRRPLGGARDGGGAEMPYTRNDFVGRRTSKHDLLYPRQGWAGGASFYPFAGLPSHPSKDFKVYWLTTAESHSTHEANMHL
ncbi:hypothetical protein EVAR_92808_1 [Eumeta japonica]|uniref:Uncharacterized protein n=1 Tax=Eumeta variegata TaxID=151549 RepID=A0A4C1T9S2_EUMVA|nr:hypothetical protein EVAR_92808_1 [Eumeta japonica]